MILQRACHCRIVERHQRVFLAGLGNALRIRRRHRHALAFPILLLEDVGGALVAREQIGPVVRADEGLQRLHARQQADEIVLAAEREHGVDEVMTHARLALLHLQAVGEEVQQIALGNRQTQAIGGDELDAAKGSTPKREGIARSGRLLVDGEETSQRIQLVRQRNRHRHRRRRNLVPLPHRLVMIADCVRDGIRQTLRAGIIAAHKALKLGELADHLGNEIGLGEPRGLLGLIRVSALDNALLHQPARQLRHALDLVGNGTQLLVEGDPRELPRVVLKPRLLVLFPEEARVGKPRGQHLAIARDDRGAAVLRLDVRRADERIGERAGLVAQHEIFLVDPQRELDHLWRHLEERRIEAAEQRDGPFGQPCIFRDEARVRDQLQPCLCGKRIGARLDDDTTLRLIDDDMGRAKLLGISRRAGDGDAPLEMEAMPGGHAVRRNPLDLERHDLLAEQRHDALQRPHPAQALGGEARIAPAHRLGPGEGAHDRRDCLSQHVRGCAAGLLDDGEPHAVTILKLVLREPRLAQEAFQRLRGRRCARAFELLAHRLRCDGQIMRDQREPSRRRIAGELTRLEAGFRQPVREQPRQILARLGLHARRDFLAAQFKKKVRAHAAHPLIFIQASQLPFAMSRTRPI